MNGKMHMGCKQKLMKFSHYCTFIVFVGLYADDATSILSIFFNDMTDHGHFSFGSFANLGQ